MTIILVEHDAPGQNMSDASPTNLGSVLRAARRRILRDPQVIESYLGRHSPLRDPHPLACEIPYRQLSALAFQRGHDRVYEVG